MALKLFQNRQRGFTLAEILITSTIIVILGLALLIGINPMLQIFKGYDASRKADLYKLKTAFESYFSDHECYPPADILTKCDSNALLPYLSSIPCDPQTNAPYTLTILPSNSTCPQQFAIYTTLQSTIDDQAHKYPECVQKMVVSSGGMTYIDIINACSKKPPLCPVYYGCKSGLCVAVARDQSPTCKLNYCFANCGGVDCSKKVRGRFTNECIAF